MSLHRVLRTIGKTTSIDEIETQAPGNGEMLVEPLFVGVCGTDLQIIRRQRPDPATILGHEGVARIIQGGDEKSMQAGSLIVFNSVDPTDQNQILGHNIPGLLQERFLVSRHAVKQLTLPFSGNGNPMLGALSEPLGTVIYGHQLVAKVVEQSCVAIVGAGAIGIMHALYAKSRGYKKVLLINTSKDRLDWCVQRGIVEAGNVFVESDDLSERVLAATNGVGVDAVYMCTSRPNALAALKRALQYVKPRGCIDLVGGIKDDDAIAELPGILDLNAVRRANFCGMPMEGYVEKTNTADDKEIFVTGHRGSSLSHLKAAAENLQAHGDLFGKVISHKVSFESAADLFNEIAKGPVKRFNDALYTKAIIDVTQLGKHIINM